MQRNISADFSANPCYNSPQSICLGGSMTDFKPTNNFPSSGAQIAPLFPLVATDASPWSLRANAPKQNKPTPRHQPITQNDPPLPTFSAAIPSRPKAHHSAPPRTILQIQRNEPTESAAKTAVTSASTNDYEQLAINYAKQNEPTEPNF
jgi:hypothetical protein